MKVVHQAVCDTAKHFLHIRFLNVGHILDQYHTVLIHTGHEISRTNIGQILNQFHCNIIVLITGINDKSHPRCRENMMLLRLTVDVYNKHISK